MTAMMKLGQQDVLDLLKLMRPWAMSRTAKVRIGEDGGYVVPASALECDTAVSIGVGPDVSFDLALAERGARVLQFDRTVNGTPRQHANITFADLACGKQTAGGSISFDDIHQRLMALQPRRSLLKLSLGKNSYDVLETIRLEHLATFEVIVCNLHDTNQLGDPNFFARLRNALEKLAASHMPVHLHADNGHGVIMVEGVPIPKVIELSFLRKDLDEFPALALDPIPGPLDRPNRPDLPDLCLNPFSSRPVARKSFYIYCDGGFGNRYNAMLSGLAIAEATGLDPVIVWPTNNWCGANFSDIFESPQLVLDRELATFVAEKDRFHHFMEEDHLGMNVPNASPRTVTEFTALLDYARATDKDVFYYVALIPPCFDMSLISKQILRNPFRQAIRERATTFIRENKLADFFGVQIRKTDFGLGEAEEQNLFNLISQAPDKLFFVCSDDKDVERRFASLTNVRIYEKQAHVEKRVDGEWTSYTADHSGRVYACNVNRGALSVIEAIVDLLILSKSRIVGTSNSTFLRAALMLQASGADWNS